MSTVDCRSDLYQFYVAGDCFLRRNDVLRGDIKQEVINYGYESNDFCSRIGYTF